MENRLAKYYPCKKRRQSYKKYMQYDSLVIQRHSEKALTISNNFRLFKFDAFVPQRKVDFLIG